MGSDNGESQSWLEITILTATTFSTVTLCHQCANICAVAPSDDPQCLSEGKQIVVLTLLSRVRGSITSVNA